MTPRHNLHPAWFYGGAFALIATVLAALYVWQPYS